MKERVKNNGFAKNWINKEKIFKKVHLKQTVQNIKKQNQNNFKLLADFNNYKLQNDNSIVKIINWSSILHIRNIFESYLIFGKSQRVKLPYCIKLCTKSHFHNKDQLPFIKFKESYANY